MEPEEILNNMLANHKQDIAFARQIALANAVEYAKASRNTYNSSDVVEIAEAFEKFLLRNTDE